MAWRERVRERLCAGLKAHLSTREVALGVALGTFVGAQPIYGLHLPVCVLVARRLKLNLAVVYGAANISNPFFAPFLVAAEIAAGRWVLTGSLDATGHEQVEHHLFWRVVQDAPDILLACLVGSQVVGVVLAALLGALVLLIARFRGGGIVS